MPIPFIIAGVVAVTAAITASKNCRSCDDMFWSSDRRDYCQYCCDVQKREERERIILAQEFRREQENEKARKKSEKSDIRERKRVEAGIQRKNRVEIDRLKAIEESKKAKIKSIDDEKKRQGILLKNKADKKRETILNTLISDFENNELSQYKKHLQINALLEINKDKNIQLKIFNGSHKYILSNKEFKKHIETYIEEA